MKEKIQVIPSGIPLADLTWGGLYRGGTYFLFGPKKSGRTILALQFARQAVRENEKCLYFTSVRPKDLMINAAAIDFDLQECMNQNSVVVVRVTPPKNVELAKDPDSYLAEYVRDIQKVVNQYHPDRIVFDELTPFVGFKELSLLNETFLETIESIENEGIISLLILGEPASPASQKVLDTLLSLSTGYISLEKKGDFVSTNEPGVMKIYPNVGHTEGKFSAEYFIEPNSGVEINFLPENSRGFDMEGIKHKEYVKLSEIKVDKKTSEPINFYSVDEFKLILNNQIAFYKSTGQPFTLVSIKLDEEAGHQKLLTLNQMQNAIRLSVDKKDKICSVKDKILVLFTKEEKEISNFIAQIINNLPNNTPDYINRISRYISLYSVEVSEETRNADEMFEQLFSANIHEKNNPHKF
jgi:circadian clock protein KaiC